MKPFFSTLKSGLKIMILPDTIAHINGHPIITATYSIYRQSTELSENVSRKETTELLEPNPDPDYLGMVRFDVPERVFSYESGREFFLDSDEVREVIQLLSEIRKDRSFWQE